jgi:hypothetical protein
METVYNDLLDPSGGLFVANGLHATLLVDDTPAPAGGDGAFEAIARGDTVILTENGSNGSKITV